MRKLILLLVMSLMVNIFTPLTGVAQNKTEEMRAVWIATVHNIDFPSVKNNPDMQKQEYIAMLDKLQNIGINTVIVQVRPKADALYKSAINPWSDVLTGKQGQDPGYDPLVFMIEEAHKRGMAFHAWLNPYRVTTSGTNLDSLSENHPARINPSWVMAYNDALYYNPEVEGVKQHIEDTVAEIVSNYNIDGIHFDDYFYPSRYPLPEGESKDGTVANQRRAHVNEMIKRVSARIKSINKAVEFGVSPMGIWKNSQSDATGSNTSGSESYYTVFADTRTWIQNEWIDYVVPQIYWETGHTAADYETLVKWWSNEVKGKNVKLYIGQGIYKDVVAAEIVKQLQINSQYEEVKGSIYFSYRDISSNRQGVADKMKTFYTIQTDEPQLPPITSQPEPPAETGEIKLVIDGIYVTPPVAPIIQQGTTLVPLRIISENLKATVDWQAQTKQITITDKGKVILLTMGNPYVEYDGDQTLLTIPPQLIEGTTMVPIRFISETLGARVDWDSETKTVSVDMK